MKILAVHPSPLMYTKIFLRLEPLGIELIASSARSAGHEVRLIDLQVESSARFLRIVRDWAPDAIAISNNYLANVPEVIELAKAAGARFVDFFGFELDIVFQVAVMVPIAVIELDESHAALGQAARHDAVGGK